MNRYKEKIEEIIEVLGISQLDLAFKLNCTVATLSRTLNGHTKVTNRALRANIDEAYEQIILMR